MKKIQENFHFKKKLISDSKFFSKFLKKIIYKYTYYLPEKIKKAVFYALFPGGKRIRPILMFSSGEMLGIEKHMLLYPACSIELIHNYSLIHDDLPSMDNDNYRRGKLTVHKKFGEANAILVGDGLLTLAFEILADWKYKSDIITKIIKIVAENSGLRGLIEGQVLDLNASQYENNERFLKNYLKKMCIKKTAKLIQASILIPAIIKNVKGRKLEILKNVGEKIGLLFQITDDLIDYSTGQDLNKICYPKVFGIEKTKAFIKALFEEINKIILQNFDKEKSNYLRFLVKMIAERKK